MDTNKNYLRKGNFYHKKRNEDSDNYVPLYLGSGDFGGCFDKNGLMNQPFISRVNQNTVFMHADFWHRGSYGLDYHIPMLQITYDRLLEEQVIDREQMLDIYEGKVFTNLMYGRSKLEMKAYFNPYLRDVFAMEITYQIDKTDDFPDIVVKNIPSVEVDYNVVVDSTFTLTYKDDKSCEYHLEAGTAQASIFIKLIEEMGNAEILSDTNSFRIRFNSGSGKCLLLIGVCNPQRKKTLLNQMNGIQEIKTYSSLVKSNWEKRWGDSKIEFDYPYLQELFMRSIYYLLCSYSPADNCIAPPTGWTGSAWAYHFPQDFSFITPALLKMGHIDIVKAKMEFYARQIPIMKEYTTRIYKAKGTMWAWEFPIGEDAHILSEQYPNWYQFEIHNAAYPTKMAFETAMHIEDNQWKNEIAWPIIYHSAQFYASILKKEGETWGIHLYPSMGQDELGGENAKNYLCALYAAKYTLKTALDMAKMINIDFEEKQQWHEILEDGLAFERLINRRLGIYQNYETDEQTYEIGKMKHPVPLMPITFLPQEELNDYETNAFSIRDKLCDKSGEHFYHGWSLVDLMLADARMEDKEQFIKDFEEMLKSDYVDKDFLQIYESSTLHPCIYYTTSHGLLAQAVIDGAVNHNVLGLKKLKYHNVHFNNHIVSGGEYESV